MPDHGGLKAFRVSDGWFLRLLDLPGSGPPVVWIHGWQCSSTGELLPAAVQPPLRERRSLLVDLLGHGYSDKPDGFSYTLVDHARTVVELIDGLGIERCTLVGHSMGGEIAIRVAAARPDVVETLVMVEGTVDPHGEEVFEGQSEEEFVASGFMELVAAQRSSAESDPAGVPAVHLGLTQLLEPRAVYRSDVSMRDGHDPSARSLLAGLSARLWYLEGELSEPDPEFEAGLRELGVTYLRVPDTGHAMGLQNPHGLAEAIAAILSGTAAIDS
ncbi:alpha/beta fold hydrolase [Nocardioides cynanchi]|uniref:alpha/beta fold hydrolase n=1 Tax=Nocardioides cynanchi TaxID=2558918 RepID=UPI001246BE8B|nr:alpha/beta hydrolase [Nocardioides cynanchi]